MPALRTSSLIGAVAAGAGLFAAAPQAAAAPDCDWIVFNTDSTIRQDNGVNVHVSWNSRGGGTASYDANGVTMSGPVTGGPVKGTDQLDLTIAFSPTGGSFGGSPTSNPDAVTNHYTGTINSGGGASGTTTNNRGASNGWTVDGGFKCIGRAPASSAAPSSSAPSSTPPPPAEKPPTDAIRVLITRSGVNIKVNVSSIANIPGSCHYSAREVHGVGIPVDRDFEIDARGTTTLTFLAPLIGQTYNVVVACHGDFKGQDVEFGRQEQKVSG